VSGSSDSPAQKPPSDFSALFACFAAHRVRYLVVGGHAVAFHAKPRFTKDIDVWLETTPENARRVLAALDEFGFGQVGLREEDFTTPDMVVQLGIAPNRIDLLTAVDGVEFAEAWEGRVEGAFGDQRVFYLGRRELVRNKTASGRPQDLADLEALGPPE
jgi:hypothetical protein